jgi:hypothetical protein
MNELFLLCHEFGFTGILSQISGSIDDLLFVEDGTVKAAIGMTGTKSQVRRVLSPLQESLS